MLALLLVLAAPVPVMKPSWAVVLDDSDPEYQGKAAYEDGLSFLSSGKLTKRITGLNICQEIGSPHRLAVDPARKCVWVSETVGGRLLKYSLEGKELLSVRDVKGYGLAVDPATGNVWVARTEGGGRILAGSVSVHAPDGKLLATHPAPGYDITFDPKGKAFWLVGQELIKVSLEGKVLHRRKVADWYAVSIAACPRTGNIWISERKYDARRGQDRLLAFDGDGKELLSIPLPGACLRVAIDPKDGHVWAAASHKKVGRYSPEGKLLQTYPVEASTLDVDHATGGVWAVTPEETLRMTRDGKITSRVKHRAKSLQAWVASW
jgi:DNA-binding beta-propeller fold protein YncE